MTPLTREEFDAYATKRDAQHLELMGAVRSLNRSVRVQNVPRYILAVAAIAIPLAVTLATDCVVRAAHSKDESAYHANPS